MIRRGFRALLRGMGKGFATVKVPYRMGDEVGYAEVISPSAKASRGMPPVKNRGLAMPRTPQARAHGRNKGFRRWFDQLRGPLKHGPVKALSRLVHSQVFAEVEARLKRGDYAECPSTRRAFYRKHPELLPVLDYEGELTCPRWGKV